MYTIYIIHTVTATLFANIAEANMFKSNPFQTETHWNYTKTNEYNVYNAKYKSNKPLNQYQKF